MHQEENLATPKSRRSAAASPPLTLRLGVGLITAGLLVSGCAASPSPLNPYGPDASRIALLSWIMFAVAAIVLIFITILIFIVISRSRPAIILPAETPPDDKRAINWVLIGGVAVPAIVLMVMMGLGIAFEQVTYARAQAAQAPVIEVVGHQWWWEVRYPNQGVVTANEIHIPANTPVDVKLTTADVIHSFWVPQLHDKMDLIPGQTNTITLEADKPGIYRGQCAEFCGLQHAHMAFLVIADAPGDFNTWLAQQQKSASEPDAGSLEQEGQQAFLGSSCVYCHTIRGTNASGDLGPDLTHFGNRLTIGADTLPHTAGNLAGWVSNSQAIKPGNRMPPMDLDSDQLQAVIAYLESLK